ncbi:MAG: hypothetical protein RL071_3682 [Pseudomonadota bacterium]
MRVDAAAFSLQVPARNSAHPRRAARWAWPTVRASGDAQPSGRAQRLGRVERRAADRADVAARGAQNRQLAEALTAMV